MASGKVWSFSYYRLPDFKTRCSTRTLDLTGFDGRNMGKDNIANILSNNKANNTVRREAVQAVKQHMYTAQVRNTQDDSCGHNGWHPTETKCVTSKKTEYLRKPISSSHPTKRHGRQDHLWDKSFFPNKSDRSAGSAA